MFSAACAPRARLLLGAEVAEGPQAAAAQSASSCSTRAYPVPAKNKAASIAAGPAPPREPPATPPTSEGAASGAWKSSPASPRQEHPFLTQPALQSTRLCASASHHSFPLENMPDDLTFDGPPFSYRKTSAQSPCGPHAQATPERTLI